MYYIKFMSVRLFFTIYNITVYIIKQAAIKNIAKIVYEYMHISQINNSIHS